MSKMKNISLLVLVFMFFNMVCFSISYGDSPTNSELLQMSVNNGLASKKMTDLGDLGGYPMTMAYDMNEKGQIVGMSLEEVSNQQHGFLWENGVMSDLGTLGGEISRAYGINANGQIIGDSTTADGKTHAFLWENGKMIDLGTLGGSRSHATAINDKGQIVGYSQRSGDGQSHAFLWQNGKMTDLGTLGGNYSEATGINNKGQIIGNSDRSYYGSYAFLWENGKMTDLGTLGGQGSSVVDINENGQILCNSYTNDSFNRQAFIWQNGKKTKLGTLGGTESVASAINESGQVVGLSYLSDNKTAHGFLWSNGKMTDCTPYGTFGKILINNKGQVCVEFIDTNGKSKVHIRNNGTITELGTLGGSNTYLRGLNNSGNVVGYSQTAEDSELRAFYWDNGQMIDTGFADIRNSGSSILINDNGQISGTTYDKMGIYHAFQWFQGKLTDLGTLGGLNKSTYVTGINDQGQVIGLSNTCENLTHSYVWKDNIMTDLGVPGRWSSPKAINNKGQIIGEHYYDDEGHTSGFLWDNGKFMELGTLGEKNSEVIAINEKGQIIGHAAKDLHDILERRAFVWDNGKMLDIGSFGGTYTTAIAINNNGQVIGNSLMENYQTRGFIWQNGKMTDLGTLGGPSSEAIAINEKGQVIGVSYTAGNAERHGFIWEDGKMTDLGTLGGRYSTPVAINNKGQITGTADKPDNSTHGFMWEGGKITDLGTLGGRCSTPKAINELGQIIGTSTTVNTSTERVGFIWQNGKMTSLGTLGGSTSSVIAINNRGEVIGTSTLKEGDNNIWHAFFWYDGKMIDMGTLGGGRSNAYFINSSGYVAGTTFDIYGKQRGYVWSLYPQITIEDYVKTPTNQDIIVKARTNEGVLKESSHTFTENGCFTFIATGDNGMTSSLDVTVTNIDKTAPMISLQGSSYIKIKEGDLFVDEGVTALDNMDGDITTGITVTGSVDNTKAGLYTLQYDVTDQAGNPAQTVKRQIEVTPGSVPQNQQISNPSFDKDTLKWMLWTEGTAIAEGVRDTNEYDTAPASYRIDCHKKGTQNNHIQLITSGLDIQSGRLYELSFRAKSKGGKITSQIWLMKRLSPWTNYSTVANANIDEEWATYKVYFKANMSDKDSRITFFLGNGMPEGSSLYIDTISFSEVKPVQMISNTNFNTNTAGWSLWNQSGAFAIGQRDSTGVYRIDCTTKGSAMNHIQLYTTGLNIKAGNKYELTFDAMSSGGDIQPLITLMKKDSPWTPYGVSNSVKVSSKWSTYKVNFTSSTTDKDGRITFFLGDRMVDGSKLYLDNISLIEIP